MSIFDPEYKQKLIERLEERARQGKLPEIYRLGVHLTPEQRIEEAQRESAIGHEELFAEYEYMQELKRRGGIK